MNTTVDVHIVFRGIESSSALERRIRDHAAHLARFCGDISSCHVAVELPHRHKHQGKQFHARVDVRVPDAQIIADRDPAMSQAHEDAHTAVNNAFRAAGRQLRDYVQQRRSHVKHHEPASHGTVSKLFPYMNYGVIETPDGRDIYFHRNSVTNVDFDALSEGMAVRFAEEAGEQGPQASSVVSIGKHHVVP